MRLIGAGKLCVLLSVLLLFGVIKFHRLHAHNTAQKSDKLPNNSENDGNLQLAHSHRGDVDE